MPKKQNKTKKEITIANLHICIRWDQTLCHKLTMRQGIFHILKENVKLIHLCVCMGVYRSTGGGLGGIMCVWVQYSMSVWGGLRKREAVKTKKDSKTRRDNAF